eukprot:3003953-Pleurochrysis_carterae.AAC.1
MNVSRQPWPWSHEKAGKSQHVSTVLLAKMRVIAYLVGIASGDHSKTIPGVGVEPFAVVLHAHAAHHKEVRAGVGRMP